MFFSLAVIVLLGLVTEMIVQVSQPYASHKVVLAVSQSFYEPCGVVSNSKNYCEQ